MATRFKRTFNESDKRQLLKDLETWRDVCRMVCTKAPIKGEVYKLADKLMYDIDTAVETLTGDRKLFHGR